MEKKIKYAVLLLIAVNLAIVAVAFLGGQSTSPAVSLPVPNGYDDFARASLLVTPTLPALGTLGDDKLRALIAANAEALRILRAGLAKQSRVPVEYSESYANGPDPVKRQPLAEALDAEAELAQREARTNDVLRIALESLRFAQESVRGEFDFHVFTGLNAEGVAIKRLRSLATGLDAAQCRHAIATLDALEKSREPLADAIARDKALLNHLSRKTRLKFMLETHSLAPLTPLHRQAEYELQTRTTEERQLILAFAIRAFTLEKGSPPANPAALVPAYLSALPRDAVSGTNLVEP